METNKIAGHKRRITVRLTHPNPLFEKWLTEWKLEAESKDTKLKYTFQNALNSLKKYPIPLESGKECGILKGFGARLCQMLDQRLLEYRQSKSDHNDSPIQEVIENELVSKSKRVKKSKILDNSTQKTSNNTIYSPRVGTGSYAILLALFLKEQEPTYPGFMLKSELIQSAQHYSDKSMNVAEPGTRYTAWSSMKMLLDKNLIQKRGNPAKFLLSEDGRNIAVKLHEEASIEDLNDPLISNPLESLPKFRKKSLEIPEVISLDDDESHSTTDSDSYKFHTYPTTSKDYISTKLPRSIQKVETGTKPSTSKHYTSANQPRSAEKVETYTKPSTSKHYTSANQPRSAEKVETYTKPSITKDYTSTNLPRFTQVDPPSKEYIPNSGSNEFTLLMSIFLKSQELSYPGFLLKYDLPNNDQNISSLEILLKNDFIADDFGKISITDKGLNTAITLYASNDFEPSSKDEKRKESNEEIIEGLLQSPLFNKFRISPINFEHIENNEFPINSPPKSPLNWELSTSPIPLKSPLNWELPKSPNQSKSPLNCEHPKSPLCSPSKSPMNWRKYTTEKSSKKIETICLDSDDENSNEVVVLQNPIFNEIRSKFSDIQASLKTVDSNHMIESRIIKTLDFKESLKKKETKVNSKSVSDVVILSKPSTSNNENVKKILNQKKFVENLKKNNSPNQNINTKTNFDDIIFQPSQFEIILLVDTQETSGSKKSNLNDKTQHELTRYGIKYEIRRLSVGDFAWIARTNTQNQELMLPYILERKRMDDLGSSIKDGRFHEQKFRLKHSGVQNLIYLVESYGSKDHLGLPYNTLLQAATNTQIQENFIVKFTECHKHSMAYISTFTKQLIQIYKDKTLMGCSKDSLIDFDIIDQIIPLLTFSEFNKASTKNKNIKVRDLFIRQLLQIKGVSFEKAMAITETYPTPLRLRIAYMKNPDYFGEKLLSSIQYNKMNRCIGPVISKTIYQLYTKDLL